MPSVGATRLLAIHEEPDMSVEAVVAAAIRLHEWVETNLRRLATGHIPFSSSEVAAAVSSSTSCPPELVIAEGSDLTGH